MIIRSSSDVSKQVKSKKERLILTIPDSLAIVM